MNLSEVRERFNHLNLINSDDDKVNAETHGYNCDYYDSDEFKKLTQTLPANNFSLLHTNIRSLNANHKLVTMLFTHLYAFDVISLTETWDQNKKNMNSYLDLLKLTSILMVYLVNLKKVVVVSTLRIS